jgi:hypothetical protein
LRTRSASRRGKSGLAGDDVIHAVRAIRAALHGFAVLERQAQFRMGPKAERSFERMLGRGPGGAPTGQAMSAAPPVVPACGVPQRMSVLKPWMVRLGGLFSSDVGESAERLYQYERAHRFDSTKIARTFGITPTPYLEGIRETVAWLKRR